MNQSCLVCDHNVFCDWFSKKSNGNDYTFIKCQCCGFVTVSPYPDKSELEKFYREDYDVAYMAMGNRRVRELNCQRLQYLLPYKNSGTLLEIGCGSGHFLHEAKQYFISKGIDITPDAVNLARRNPELDVELSDIFSFYPPQRFDVISLFHVIEHVHDPNAVLQRLSNWCKPDGVLYMICPNVASLSSRIFGKHWEWFNPPRHLSYFSPSTMTMLLERSGFEVLFLSTQRGDDRTLLFGLLFLMLSISGLKQRLLNHSFSHAQKRNTKAVLFLYEAIFSLTNSLSSPLYPLRRVLEQRQLGSEIVVIARCRQKSIKD